MEHGKQGQGHTGSERTAGRIARRRGHLVPGALLASLAGALLTGAAGAATPLHVPSVLPLLQEGAQTPEKYVLAGSTGATLLNLPNDKGHDVLRVSGETPLAVHPYREGSGFLKVTVPGGVKVWVYGKYLKQSARPGWVEVTGSYVNMRPRPRSANSYPMGQLDRGDRLRFIQRKDTSKPMTEDWVQVWSPPDTKAYVLAAETLALPAGANAKVLWDAAVGAALAGQPEVLIPAGGSGGTTQPIEAASTPTTPQGTPSQGSGGAATAGIFASLATANAEMDKALAGDDPDYDKLYKNYQDILAMGPDAPTRKLIQDRLERLSMLQEIAQIRADVQKQSAAREQQLEELRESVDQGQRKNDPLWGRFQTRGWLELQVTSGEKLYLVRWGSDILARVQCSSGRYDLDLYDGVEIGVTGAPVRAAEAKSGGHPLIDIDRIEVISVRMRTR